jgi:hypothetical protein
MTRIADAAAWLASIMPSPKNPAPLTRTAIIVANTITPSATVAVPSARRELSDPDAKQYADDHLRDPAAALDPAGAQRDCCGDRREERLRVP